MVPCAVLDEHAELRLGLSCRDPPSPHARLYGSTRSEGPLRHHGGSWSRSSKDFPEIAKLGCQQKSANPLKTNSKCYQKSTKKRCKMLISRMAHVPQVLQIATTIDAFMT